MESNGNQFTDGYVRHERNVSTKESQINKQPIKYTLVRQKLFPASQMYVYVISRIAKHLQLMSSFVEMSELSNVFCKQPIYGHIKM